MGQGRATGRIRTALTVAFAAFALAGCGRAGEAEAAGKVIAGADVAPVPAPIHPRIGMNLALYGNSYFGSEHPFLDRFKASSGWGAQNASYAKVEAPIPMDANGWPTALPPTAIRLLTLVPVDPLSAPTPHRYVITWSGDAQVDVQNAKVVDRGNRRLTFDFDAEGSAMQLYVSTIDAKQPIRDIHVVRIDQQPLFAAGQVFNPAFLQNLSHWQLLRFMDWGLTNGATLQHWSERPKPSDATWGAAVPLEAMIDLANAAKTDIWLNVPAEADDDYVRHMLALVRDRLAPGHKLYVEYSNEIWNTGFPQAQYATAQAAARLPGVPGERMLWSGYRSAQIAHLTDEVFGAASKARVANVLASMSNGPGMEDFLVAGIAQARLGRAADLFEAYAITAYFGSTIGGGGTESRIKQYDWARQGAAGVDHAFAEIEHGTELPDSAESLDWLRDKTLPYHAKVARKLGLPLVAYEGGLHVINIGWGDKQQVMSDFVSRIVADPRLGRLYRRMVRDFGAAGGRELTIFNDSTPQSSAGVWGTVDDIYQTSTPRYDALKAEAALAGQPLKP